MKGWSAACKRSKPNPLFYNRFRVELDRRDEGLTGKCLGRGGSGSLACRGRKCLIGGSRAWSRLVCSPPLSEPRDEVHWRSDRRHSGGGTRLENGSSGV